MTKRQYMTKLLLFVACTVAVLTGCVRRDEPELVGLQQERTDTSEKISAGTSSISASSLSGSTKLKEVQEAAQGTITVYVCGAVQNPGVYDLEDGARICDAVEAAGGFSDNADPSYLNQAEYAQDAQKLEVPTLEEAQKLREETSVQEAAGTAGDNTGTGDGKVSINDADVTGLMQLPGIGEGKAKAIIEYREKNGRFKNLEDLMQVPGIKQASFDKLKDSIKL